VDNALLLTYNLASTVNFPTRIQNNSRSMINNLFIDISEMENYTICPLINSLLDHNAPLEMTSNRDLWLHNYQIQTIRKINKDTIAGFVINLSYETWESVFDNSYVN
jgi:hypothetical protein